MADEVEGVPAEKLPPLREALAAMVRDGMKLGVRPLRERAKAKTEHAQAVLAAYRAGRFSLEAPRPAPAPTEPVAPGPTVTELLEPQGHGGALRRATAEDPPPNAATAQQLSVLVAGIDSHEKALDVTREVARARIEGTIGEKLADFLLEAIKEARQSIKGAAQEGGDEVEDLRPCTAEGAELVAVFEGITDDARRERVLAFVRAELAADEAAGPRALGQGEAPAEPAGGGEA